MSVRYLYKTIPQSQRVCSIFRCQKPILRNIIKDERGRIYHYGCLQTARDERYRRLNCFTSFDATEASCEAAQRFFNNEFSERLRALCPNCGSINLKEA